MKLGDAVAVLGAALLASCAQQPIQPSPQHLGPPAVAAGEIPPPVGLAPVLPAPKPTVPPETYSVVVNNVRVQDLLFALARDARINVDVSPDVSGTVTLNAIDQTLPQLLERIERQVDVRHEFHGNTLFVTRDTPFLRTYKVDYLSAKRDVKLESSASTQFSAAQGSGTTGAASTATGATAKIDVTAENKLWDSIVQNIKDILRETDRIIPASAVPGVPAAAAAAPGAAAAAPGAASAAPTLVAPQPTSVYQEAASVIANPESGVLFVRATARQHEKVQAFLDQVLASARRQVLIEATVAEVQLRNEYQRGIDWSKLQTGTAGFSITRPALTPPSGFSLNPFLIGYASASRNFNITLRLLEQFGDVRVLSTPKLSVMNNQTAILRVTRDIIYFTITPSTQGVAVSGAGTVQVQPSFTTTPNVAAEGFMMTVLPFINDNEGIVLNIKPTIRRRVDSVTDPNPALQATALNPNPVPNIIPVFETREFDSVLKLRSGETAVLAGLMQDSIDNNESNIPGIRSIPIIGNLLEQRADLSTKTELVIFLRATVVNDPSLNGDFSGLRNLLPGQDFFTRPNPVKNAPPVLPGAERP